MLSIAATHLIKICSEANTERALIRASWDFTLFGHGAEHHLRKACDRHVSRARHCASQHLSFREPTCLKMDTPRDECSRVITGIYGLVTEAWGQGFVVGGLGILLLLTIASMRGGIVLHKLIIAELFMASIHTTFIFVTGPAAGWYTSTTAIFLYASYNLHNVINWIKVKPFLGRWGSLLYIGTVILAAPYWIAETYFNFVYNNNRAGGRWFPKVRPWEALCREPWWLFTSCYLIFTIKRSYNCSILRLVRTSGKFGVLMFSMAASIAFIFADIITLITLSSPCAGENPFWKVCMLVMVLNRLTTNR